MFLKEMVGEVDGEKRGHVYMYMTGRRNTGDEGGRNEEHKGMHARRETKGKNEEGDGGVACGEVVVVGKKRGKTAGGKEGGGRREREKKEREKKKRKQRERVQE
jgi:hypothetical protein